MKVDENWDTELYKSGFAVRTLGKRTFGQRHQEEEKSAGNQASSLTVKLRSRQ